MTVLAEAPANTTLGSVTVGGTTADIIVIRSPRGGWARFYSPAGITLGAPDTLTAECALAEAPAELAEEAPHVALAARGDEIATIRTPGRRVRVLARFDQRIADVYGPGFPGLVAADPDTITVYVPTADASAADALRILADHGRCPR